MSRTDWLAFGFAIIIVGATLDVLSTLYALTFTGLAEGNPLALWVIETIGIWALIPTKALWVFAVYGVISFLGNDAEDLWFICTVWGVGLFWGIVAINNMYLILSL